MKVLIAIDSFKGSLTSLEAGESAQEGIKKAVPHAKTVVVPVSDGGEGFLESLVTALKGEFATVTASDPLGRKISCRYGVIGGKTAIIETASAAGLTLVKKEELCPMRATSYGVGEIIRDAIERGCRNFIIGLGGSAVNDGGAGMLQALGFQLLDKQGREIPFGAESLGKIEKIKTHKAVKELKECHFDIACDVNNPLCGERGCSVVFAPQKGAGVEEIETMDSCLLHFAKKTREIIKDADENYPGAGAAGGMGFAFLAYLNSRLLGGFELIARHLNLEEKIKGADIVVTGEGKIDNQTLMGKVPAGVAALGKKYGKPVIALAGEIAQQEDENSHCDITASFSVLRGITTLERAMQPPQAKRNISDTALRIFRLINALEKRDDNI